MNLLVLHVIFAAAAAAAPRPRHPPQTREAESQFKVLILLCWISVGGLSKVES